MPDTDLQTIVSGAVDGLLRRHGTDALGHRDVARDRGKAGCRNTRFKVMARPFKAINLRHQGMAQELMR